jgi:hypothetical protein
MNEVIMKIEMHVTSKCYPSTIHKFLFSSLIKENQLTIIICKLQ